MSDSSPYNYESFPLDMDRETFARFPTVLLAGGPAPDGELIDARDGRRVRLSDFWRRGPLVIEFGSFS